MDKCSLGVKMHVFPKLFLFFLPVVINPPCWFTVG